MFLLPASMRWRPGEPRRSVSTRGERSSVRCEATELAEHTPAISVVMPVYNTERYLAPAVESILNQSFKDFEFIILDDGSTDGSVKMIQEYAERDGRIRFFPLEHRGYVSLLRRGLNHSRGEFIARMDSDDIATHDRFEKQMAYMRAHPECVALGSRVVLIDPFGSRVEKPAHKLSHEEIEAELLAGIGWAIVHPTVIMRRDAVTAAGG